MIQTIKGFKDYSGEQARKRAEIKKIIEEKFKLYGFEPAETPVVEAESFVKGENINDEAVSDIFKLQDKGKRKLALRYEFTFQLGRLAKNKKLPYKRYQIGPVFRDEPTSTTRFRQFTQCDADTLGSTIREDAEILALANKIMRDLGIKSTIKINNRKLVNEILEENKVKTRDRNQVMREIDKLDKLSEGKVKANLKKLGAEKILAILKKPESYFKKYKNYDEIEELKKYCRLYGVKVEFQPSLVRGLSYYNGSIFEIKVAKTKDSIAAGGSYLINKAQATGISFGLDRLSQFAKIKIDDKLILITSINQDNKAIKLAEKLRNKGINCNVMYKKPTKVLEYANSKRINYVIFIGKKEVEKKKVKLRNMKSGKESMISENELIKKLR